MDTTQNQPGASSLSIRSHSPLLTYRNGLLFFFPINFFPQYPRALKSDHLTEWQRDLLPALRVPAPALVLLVYTEFPQPADQHIVAFFQGLLEQLEKGFNNLCRLCLCEQIFGKQISHDVSFGQRSQWDCPLWLCSGCRHCLAFRAIDFPIFFALIARVGKVQTLQLFVSSSTYILLDIQC